MARRKEGFSRRTFLKGAGVVGGTAVAKGAGALPSPRSRTLGPGPARLRLRVNGRDRDVEIEPRVTLLNALRDHLGTTGPKDICDRGSCGGCTVLLDDRPVLACLMLAADAEGHEITTVEGLAREGALSPLQDAFLECDGLQCGFCTAGMIVSCEALLRATPRPTDDQIRVAVSGNLCRCGTYPRVVAACRRAAEGR